MAKVEIRGSIANLSAAPDIAFQFQDNGQPWPSVAQAHNGTPVDYRAIGKIRFVDTGAGMKEYWYKGGTALENLVLRYQNLDSAEAYVTQLNQIKQQTQQIRDDAASIAATALSEYQEMGDWNPATNTPQLTSNANNGKTGDKYLAYTIVTPGNLPFPIRGQAQGTAIGRGRLLGHPSGQWFYDPTNQVFLDQLTDIKNKAAQIIPGPFDYAVTDANGLCIYATNYQTKFQYPAIAPLANKDLSVDLIAYINAGKPVDNGIAHLLVCQADSNGWVISATVLSGTYPAVPAKKADIEDLSPQVQQGLFKIMDIPGISKLDVDKNGWATNLVLLNGKVWPPITSEDVSGQVNSRLLAHKPTLDALLVVADGNGWALNGWTELGKIFPAPRINYKGQSPDWADVPEFASNEAAWAFYLEENKLFRLPSGALALTKYTLQAIAWGAGLSSDSDFLIGDETWYVQNPKKPYSMQRATNRQNMHLRFEVRYTENWKQDVDRENGNNIGGTFRPRERTEIYRKNMRGEYDQPIFFSFWIKIEPGDPIVYLDSQGRPNKDWYTDLLQWHQAEETNDAKSGPSFNLTILGDGLLTLETRGQSGQYAAEPLQQSIPATTRGTYNVNRGEWNRVFIEAVHNPDHGKITWWMNGGDPVCSYNDIPLGYKDGPNEGYLGGNSGYPKIGIYRTSNQATMAVQFACLEVSTDAAKMRPRINNPLPLI